MRGATTIKNARDEAKRRQAENQSNYEKPFILQTGESAIVRFLETGDDLVCAYVHHIKLPGQKMPRKIVCRDQDVETGARIGEDCPGCDSNDIEIAKRRLQGAINVLWRDAPVFERDSDNRLVRDGRNNPVVASRTDQIAVWTAGPRVFDELIREDIETPGGLTGRDWKVTKEGAGRDTVYDIRPAVRDGGQSPLSDEDEKLTEGKYDLTKYETPLPYESWWGNLQVGESSQSSRRVSFDRGTQHVPADVSPFTNSDDE